MRLETNNWKSHRIADLFIIKNTNCILNREIIPDSGETPYVTASSLNNGVQTYIDFDQKRIEKGNCILIGGKTMSITYQSEDFFSNDSHNLALYLKDEQHRTIEVQFYLMAVLKNILGKKYQWSDSISSRAIIEDEIDLPTKADGNPDYSLMAEYITNRMKFVKHKLDRLVAQFTPPCKSLIINTLQWKEFSVGDLFLIVQPKVYHRREVKKCADGIDYVTRSKFNNGVTAIVGKPHEDINPVGVISFGAENSSFFYRDNEWISGRDIYYIDTRHLSRQACHFIIVCLQTIVSRYAYNFGLFPEHLRKETILLPATPDGSPDFAYMEHWVEERQKAVQKKLESLKLLAAS